jgi:hypothetical protein
MGFQNSVTGGQGALERQQIKSPNFVSGSTGWAIKRDGSAEFNNIVIRGGTTVGSTSLWYAGTPAAGNLIFSISGTSGTDAYGNHYAQGVVTYRTGLTTDVSLSQGTLKIGSAAGDFVHSARIFQSLLAGGSLDLETGTGDSNHGDGIRASFTAGKSSQPTGGADTPNFSMIDDDLTSAVDLLLSGSIIKTDLSGNAATWQSPSYNANWVAGTTLNTFAGPGMQYRLMADDTLWLYGLSHANVGAGTSPFTLPAGYRPAAAYTNTIYNDNSGNIGVKVSTAGVVTVQAAPGGANFMFDHRIPLGNVA